MFNRRSNDSRRTVQRRFAPGTFVVEPVTHRLAMVVGWTEVAPVVNPRTGEIREVQTWEVVVLSEERLKHVRWDKLREEYSLDEWEGE